MHPPVCSTRHLSDSGQRFHPSDHRDKCTKDNDSQGLTGRERGDKYEEGGKLEPTPFTKLSFLRWKKEMTIDLTSQGCGVHAGEKHDHLL